MFSRSPFNFGAKSKQIAILPKRGWKIGRTHLKKFNVELMKMCDSWSVPTMIFHNLEMFRSYTFLVNTPMKLPHKLSLSWNPLYVKGVVWNKVMIWSIHQIICWIILGRGGAATCIGLDLVRWRFHENSSIRISVLICLRNLSC